MIPLHCCNMFATRLNLLLLGYENAGTVQNQGLPSLPQQQHQQPGEIEQEEDEEGEGEGVEEEEEEEVEPEKQWEMERESIAMGNMSAELQVGVLGAEACWGSVQFS